MVATRCNSKIQRIKKVAGLGRTRRTEQLIMNRKNRKTLYLEKLFSIARKEKGVRDRSLLYIEKNFLECTANKTRLVLILSQ
jgi:hypothetical protein